MNVRVGSGQPFLLPAWMPQHPGRLVACPADAAGAVGCYRGFLFLEPGWDTAHAGTVPRPRPEFSGFEF